MYPRSTGTKRVTPPLTEDSEEIPVAKKRAPCAPNFNLSPQSKAYKEPNTIYTTNNRSNSPRGSSPNNSQSFTPKPISQANSPPKNAGYPARKPINQNSTVENKFKSNLPVNSQSTQSDLVLTQFNEPSSQSHSQAATKRKLFNPYESVEPEEGVNVYSQQLYPKKAQATPPKPSYPVKSPISQPNSPPKAFLPNQTAGYPTKSTVPAPNATKSSPSPYPAASRTATPQNATSQHSQDFKSQPFSATPSQSLYPRKPGNPLTTNTSTPQKTQATASYLPTKSPYPQKTAAVPSKNLPSQQIRSPPPPIVSKVENSPKNDEQELYFDEIDDELLGDLVEDPIIPEFDQKPAKPVKSVQLTIPDCLKQNQAPSKTQKTPSKASARDKATQKTQEAGETEGKSEGGVSWLEDIRDDKGRAPNDPDYDETTLYIPENEFRGLTDTRKQYWAWKRKHFDVILFFQGGAFFELYGNDALLGVKLFDLKITARHSTSFNVPMAGVPVTYYTLYASKFVALGYKVAKMEQVHSEFANNDDNLRYVYFVKQNFYFIENSFFNFFFNF